MVLSAKMGYMPNIELTFMEYWCSVLFPLQAVCKYQKPLVSPISTSCHDTPQIGVVNLCTVCEVWHCRIVCSLFEVGPKMFVSLVLFPNVIVMYCSCCCNHTSYCINNKHMLTK